jgi:hypothetical protein
MRAVRWGTGTGRLGLVVMTPQATIPLTVMPYKTVAAPAAGLAIGA